MIKNYLWSPFFIGVPFLAWKKTSAISWISGLRTYYSAEIIVADKLWAGELVAITSSATGLILGRVYRFAGENLELKHNFQPNTVFLGIRMAVERN